MASAGDTRGLIRDLKAQGWDVAQTSRGHYRAKSLGVGQIVHFSDSADPRAWHNIMSQLTRPSSDAGSATCPVCGGGFDEQAGECLGACAAEPAEQDLEQYWAKLKAAKELLLLAEDEAENASKAAQEAVARQQEAQKQVKRCQQVLASAKSRFDKAFGG